MAVIKCPNCENEILDSEIVCPYCDFPIKKPAGEKSTESVKMPIDDATGKIPVKSESTEPKIATSSDFEKEKAAILKDIKLTDPVDDKKTENADATSSDLGKTVKISLDDIVSGKTKSVTSSTSKITPPKTVKKPIPKGKKYKKTKAQTKYIILAVTIIGVILIAMLVSKITGTISDGINRQKKTNKTVTVTSSAEQIDKEQGFTFSSSTLTIKDEKVMIDYASSKDTPWYQYKDSIKHITFGDNVTKVGAHAFENFDNLTDIKFSRYISFVGDYAFYNCKSLRKVSIPDSNDLMEIGESAFENCSKLDYISGYTKDAKFEPSIIEIGDRAFAGCSSILEFKLPDDVKLGEDVFLSHNEDFAIVCSKLGNAYEYAKDNNIPVKEDFDQGIIEEEALEEAEELEETKEETEENPDDGSTNTNDEGNNDETTNTDPGTSSTTETPGDTTGNNNGNDIEVPGDQTPEVPPANQPTDAEKEQALKDLSDQLSKATTQEEQEKILGEMDKYY